MTLVGGELGGHGTMFELYIYIYHHPVLIKIYHGAGLIKLWAHINVKDNHTRYMRRCSEWSVDEYIVYPIDVSPNFNDTATELDGWCAPKSAVCGFHADNDIDTLNLLVERGRVNYKVRVGTRKRLHKSGFGKCAELLRKAVFSKFQASRPQGQLGPWSNKGTYLLGHGAMWPHLPYDISRVREWP